MAQEPKTVSGLREAAEITDQAIDAAVDVVLADLATESYPFTKGCVLDHIETLNAMLRSGHSVPKWVTAYSRTSNGPSQPSREVKADGETFLLADVCEVHECLDHKLQVIFAPGGRRAWGRLYENGRTSWIGSPSPALREAADRIGF